MAMRFVRGWDFGQGNKPLDLNSLTQDSEVIAALQQALVIARTGVADDIPFDPAVSALLAVTVQDAIDEINGVLVELGNTVEGIAPGAALNAEGVMDLLGTTGLVAGAGVTLVYDDVTGAITVAASSAGLDAEGVMDLLGTTGLVAGTNTSLTYDDVAGTITVTATATAGGAVAAPNAQTGTAYTLVLTDAETFVTMANAAASTLTIPTNATVAFPVGTTIDGAQLGAGQVTIAGAGGVTVNATPGLKVAAQYGTFGLLKVATDTWLAYGRLAA